GISASAVLPAKYLFTMATWINDAGTIVGSLSKMSSPPWTPFEAYVYPAGGSLKILPLLPGATQMFPVGVNKAGTVVGYWDNNGLFLYKSGVLYNITNSIMPAGIYSPYPGLADSGDFVVNSTNGHYYVIKPAGP
ncbi:MAG TPA: hypothetical protein VKT72_00005, partial [Candidatus Baltobacteraceae bacterium]|nr:hypothetical protein [Candidatus Baltobacteraceae bacterium]